MVDMEAPGEDWARYGRALVQAMSEVLETVDKDVRPHLLETADYWLSVGIVLGLDRPAEARRALGVIEARADELAELRRDADEFVGLALK